MALRSCLAGRSAAAEGLSRRNPCAPLRRPLRLALRCSLDSGKRNSKQPRSGPAPRRAVETVESVVAEPAPQPLLDEPLSPLDVDQELWSVLDLCSDDELEALYSILHSTSPFSPVIKSLVVERDEPALVMQRGRRSVMHKVEAHFRFLAAGSLHLLRGARPSYREILLDVRDKLDIRCSRNLSTYDLETEIFLHILGNCVEYVHSPEHQASGVDPSTAASYATITASDMSAPGANHGSAGRTAAAAGTSGRTGAAAAASGAAAAAANASGGGQNWTERLTAPFRLGLKDLAPTLLNFAGVVTVTKVGQQAAQQLASNLVCSHVRYQAALRAATAASSGGLGLAAKGAMAGWGKQALLEAAQRSLTHATARYSALRGALSFVGPVLWGWLALDLALKAIGPDYARVVRAVFLLSQVRLVRTHGFVSTDMASMEAARDSEWDTDSDGEDYLFV
ncbi:hypothetical protein HYH03_013747 [Edaphochlamys debaryana]|uniref:Uncharacterized protein n=1 Tax=Edaphochlamys debaryana TaxID=47281 RepID=A0A835XP29_9CHLO|nr:hypothetical protein HYH03_013747 [Edaphochlamys debaryana]|eukprot:KAG2487608.1 hypothetical protein HYH03_013747 [Edaphochlamys debaryana]